MSTPIRNAAGQFAVRRTPPEDLEFRCPDCPVCMKETNCDGDSFRCDHCAATWDRDGTRGEWDEPNVAQCVSVIKRWEHAELSPDHEMIRHAADRCILSDGHHTADGTKHRDDSINEWTDESPYLTVAPPGTEDLRTLRFSNGFDGAHTVHLVRGNGGAGGGGSLCGLDRHSPYMKKYGWEISGGHTGPRGELDPGLSACAVCDRRARTVFERFQIHGVYKSLFRVAVTA